MASDYAHLTAQHTAASPPISRPHPSLLLLLPPAPPPSLPPYPPGSPRRTRWPARPTSRWRAVSRCALRACRGASRGTWSGCDHVAILNHVPRARPSASSHVTASLASVRDHGTHAAGRLATVSEPDPRHRSPHAPRPSAFGPSDAARRPSAAAAAPSSADTPPARAVIEPCRRDRTPPSRGAASAA